MERDAWAQLQEWKQRPQRKPLIVQGARQVGKTWLMKTFGARSYQRVAYVNFEANPRMDALFASDLDFTRLRTGLQIETNTTIEPDSTLLVFDEIQENPRALTALKYLAEEHPEYHIVAAGSLLGVAMHAGQAFPVGKTEFLSLRPLSFREFLSAIGQERLSELIASGDFALLDSFRDKLIELLRTYFCVGGMPEAVLRYRDTADLRQVRSLQRDLLSAYEQDFSKYAEPNLVPRIRAVWNAIAPQLAREQRKFVYSLIREGARAREFEMALQWLHGAGLVRRVPRITKPAVPIRAYFDAKAFKLFMHDTGLLAAHAGVPVVALLEGNRFLEEFKGAVTEQYVVQELLLMDGAIVGYWSAERSRAEVDCVIQMGTRVFPLEVKAAENLQAKSLRVYHESFAPARSFRTSLSPYRAESWLTNVPLYALSTLPQLMQQV